MIHLIKQSTNMRITTSSFIFLFLIFFQSFWVNAQEETKFTNPFADLMQKLKASGVIEGFIYADFNGNGTQDAGEPGLGGVRVIIINSDGQGVSVLTNADGIWSLAVEEGTKSIIMDSSSLPPGAVLTEGSDPNTVQAIANTTVQAQTKGYTFQGDATGHLYFDVNGNETQDAGEPNMPNVDVFITDQYGNTQPVTTDADGVWLATVLFGNIEVNIDETDVDFPTGALQTEGINPSTHNIPQGQTTFTENDGFFESGILRGTLYFDANENGNQDANEPGLPDIPVVIQTSLGDNITLTTDVDGFWGTRVPKGSTVSSIDETVPQFPNGATQTEGTNPTTTQVLNAQTYEETDGFFGSGILTGHLYFDTNGDATQNAGEADMPDVDISITDQYGNTQTVVTNAEGNWTANVLLGAVVINIDKTDADFPTGAFQTEGDNPSSHTTLQGQAIFTENDGFFKSGTLSGILYFDSNANGNKDAGESGISDVSVNITTSQGNNIEVVTNVNGSWSTRVPEGTTISFIDEDDPEFPNGVSQTDGENPTTTEVVNGQTYEEFDGFFASGILTGHLYFDTNGNGVQDAGEADMPDVNVRITNQYGSPQTVVVTNAEGDWTADVLIGSAEVNIDETDADFPTGALQTEGANPSTHTVMQAQSTFTENDGFYKSGILSGILYFDNNGNGTQDTGESGISDVSVEITTSLGNVIDVITDENGAWNARVPEGDTESLIVEEDPEFPEGVSQTEGSNPTTTEVINGQTYEEFDGFFSTGVLTGHLYFDTNGNGVQDNGETNMPDVDIFITDQYGNTKTVTTNADGDWTADVLFSAIEVDIDKTDADFPTGAFQTEGTNPSTHTPIFGEVTFTENDGFYESGILSGILYFDTNGNGDQDANELGISDVSVEIETSLGEPISLTTDINGSWSTRVPKGSTVSSIDETDTDFPDSVLQTEGTNPTTTEVIVGKTYLEFDGFSASGTISGHLYFDTNGNGTQDAGEADMPDVDVIITDQYGTPQTVTTTADGDWLADVLIGSVEVDIDETDTDFPTEALQTEGSNPSIHSVIQDQITFTENDGFYQSGILSGVLYYDANGNGNQDTNESGISNVSVDITTSLGDIITLTTDGSGIWSTRVPEGSTVSQIVETDPEFPERILQTEGTNPTTTDVINGQSYTESDGYIGLGILRGHLYYDANGNGTQDADEEDMPDIDIEIIDVLGNTTILVTDVNGDWNIEVPAGNTISNIDQQDPDFPQNVVQTEGTDPTETLVVSDDDISSDNDGFFENDPQIEGTLSGHLYMDVNGNGDQDSGEPDLPNIDIEITDTFGGKTILSSDANGNWSIVVPAGNTISDILQTDPDFPEGVIQTEGTDPTTTFVPADAEVVSDNDGFFEQDSSNEGTLSGHLYFDNNSNGIQDAEEPDMPDVLVQVMDEAGISQNLLTDVNGDWTAQVAAGSVTSTIDLTDAEFPQGATQTQGTNPTSSRVNAGGVIEEEADGFYTTNQTGLLSGILYDDENNNGIQDNNELGIASNEIQIEESDGSISSVTTNSEGVWSMVVSIGNTTSTIDVNGPNFPIGADQTQGTNPTTTFVGSNANVAEVPDGFFFLETRGTVLGRLYYDENTNGTQDADEDGISNVRIFITDATGAEFETETNSDGDWSFEVLAGEIISEIDQNDIDFPTNVIQTEGTNPTTTLVVAGETIRSDNDGFYIETIKTFNAIASEGSISNNKFFRIEGIENYPENSVQIFNRQGAKVYDVTNYDNTNVKFAGYSAGNVNMQKDKRLPPGTYFYILNYVNRNGKPMRRTGYIHLN